VANLSRVPKWIKFIIAILLLPICVGAAMALLKVLRASGSADTTWIPLLAGAACWIIIFSLLPKPMWIYVFGHELTHALWTWLFGGRVKKLKVSSSGGHVIISKTNFFIALAPYFFPLYVVMIIFIFVIGHLIWDWKSYLVYFHLLIGAAYAFHVTLTWHVLQTRQTDITSQGYLFSAVIIFLGNVCVLLFGIPLLAEKIGLFKALGWLFQDTGRVFLWLQKLF
jgi:Peptidase M50B-like